MELEFKNGQWVAESQEEIKDLSTGVKKQKMSKTKRNWIIGFAALIIFLAGSIGVKAATDWLSQLGTDNAVAIDAAGKAKADALTSNIQTAIASSVKTKIAPMLEQKKTDIQTQLQAYFDQKASVVTDTASYNAAVADLTRIEGLLLDNYKAQIDAAFNNLPKS